MRNRTQTGTNIAAPSDLTRMYQACVARGEKLPITFALGSHPLDFLAASTRQPGDEDREMWLVKVGRDGSEGGGRTFDRGAEDQGQGLAATNDGGYVITGSTVTAEGGNRAVWVIKTDGEGK